MPDTFSKPPKTLDEQLMLLESRGMIVQDREQAKFYLQHLNYYRLRAYWIFFESDRISHRFPNTPFQDVLNLYSFDRELRLLILDAIERIEVSVRSQWAYHLAHAYGSHAHLESALFNRKFYPENFKSLKKEVERQETQEIFIKHFQSNYVEKLPPVWVVCEVMPFGLLSKWFGMSPGTIKSKIATTYNLKAELLESWLHHLSMVRNTCAHHSRLWNRDFKRLPKLIKNQKHSLANQFVKNSRKIYNTLVVFLYLMDKIAPDHQWRKKVLKLLHESPQFLAVMDFPGDWQDRKIWQD